MKKIQLAYPQDRGTLSSANSRLQWEPLRNFTGAGELRYLLVLFATRPGLASGRRTKPLPLFKSKVLGRNFLDLPIREKGLKPGRTYWWQVQAVGRDGQVVALSEKRRFRVKKEPEPVTEVMGEVHLPEGGLYLSGELAEVFAPSLWEALSERMIPPAPAVWGKPVKVRLRGETAPEDPDSGTPTDGPGTVEPLALVWGNEAAEVYLPYYLARSAVLFWDLSYIEGCQSVLLQISGPDGFSEPGDGNVLEDANVINYYWGPPRISCGYDELETPYGPPPYGTLVSASDINLLDSFGGDSPTAPPNELNPEIVRQIRTVPCNEAREPVDMASDPVTIRCVRYPVVRIGAMTVDWIWGDNPQRVIEFSLLLEERFPNVRTMRLDEETGVMVPVTAPSTLLVYTPPGPSMLSESSCINLSLTMNGEPVERQNRITLASEHPISDSYVIPLDPWPVASGYDFRLVQQWRGGIMHNTLWDFLDPRITAAVIPGVHPSWHYCGGVYQDVDSLYGREDLPDVGTNSPLYYFHYDTGSCLPGDIVVGWYSSIAPGIEQFNDFLSSTFRGTRTVTHDLSGGPVVDVQLDEPQGEQDVVVRFETDNPNALRYVLPNTHYPVMMRETRGSRDVLWKVRYLDGVAAGLDTTGRSINIYYAGRESSAAGRSRFEPPRMEIWLAVRMGLNARGGHVWADIHYDLRAD